VMKKGKTISEGKAVIGAERRAQSNQFPCHLPAVELEG
jgi:hypothetical protein